MTTQRKVSVVWTVVFYVLLPMLLIYIAVTGINCATVDKLTKRASVTTYATIEIHKYRIKVTKLPAGSIPTNSARLLLGDSTLVQLQWTQQFATKPYNEQTDPTTYGTSSDITVYEVPNSAVWYEEVSTNNASWSGYMHFSSGEYQIQINNSIWDASKNVEVQSKYSNATGVYIDVVKDPAMAPTSVKIVIGG